MENQLSLREITEESLVIGETESLCPECMRLIGARKVAKNNNVYLVKKCPEHGSFMAIIWRADAEHYINWGKFSEPAVGPLTSITEIDKGCPFDCGICPDHKANACTMVMEVTRRCNLRCPVCFANTKASENYGPDLKKIQDMYLRVLEVTGSPAIQLSGGEPTLRDDLPHIISLGRQMGFEHILVNTNGVRIAKDPDYLRRLVDSGAGTIYLQFDGVTDAVYQYTCGANLFRLKIDAIGNCAREGVGVILVVTLTPAVNSHQMGDIVRFATKWIPTIRGVHFQPISYLGRYPTMPKDEDRITMPEVVSGLVEQTDGELKEEDFLPRRSQDAHCAFSSLFVREGDQLKPITRKISEVMVNGWGGFRRTSWESARSFISIHWRLPDREAGNVSPYSCTCSTGTDRDGEPLLWDDISANIQASGLSITCMPFQDVWTLDLDRLKRCCGHVVTPDLLIVPFCSFYLINSTGERLHPRPFTRGHFPLPGTGQRAS